MPARAIACCTAWPPSVAPWVMLNEPFQLLASGVRAVETITAAVMMILSKGGLALCGRTPVSCPCGSSVERLAFGGEPGQERRGLPELGVVVRVLREALHRLHHVEEAELVGVEHRAAAEQRKAVAGEVDHVDVARAGRDALLQDARGLVDQREHQALHDLFVRNPARRDAFLLAVLLDHLDDQRARDRVALAGL